MKDILSNWIHRLTYVTPFIQVDRLLLGVQQLYTISHILCVPWTLIESSLFVFLGKKACVLKARINPRPHHLWNIGGDASWEAKPGFYTNFEEKVEHLTSQALNVLATQIWVYLIYIFYDYDVCGVSYIGGLISEMAISKPDETENE